VPNAGAGARWTHNEIREGEQPMENIRNWFRREGLVRVEDGRVLGGVIAGLGRRLGIEPWPARLLFLIVLMLIPGSQLLVYPLLWILMPLEESWTKVSA
jgi:phage shock protein PspC (stress-responsive transcriptional regulator)